jgi:predicted transcriptional regulator
MKLVFLLGMNVFFIMFVLISTGLLKFTTGNFEQNIYALMMAGNFGIFYTGFTLMNMIKNHDIQIIKKLKKETKELREKINKEHEEIKHELEKEHEEIRHELEKEHKEIKHELEKEHKEIEELHKEIQQKNN